ncbi:class I SAM-dependent methyltransferase [Candidatus Woesearchaeota archaeon]|nr:class I SAM-dependent methyltransferase [Candidatus Woesearchaeota archaeon]
MLGYERGINHFIEKISLDCPKNCRILDIGCGTGIIGLKLMEIFPDSTLLATDIEKNFLLETIKNAKKRKLSTNRISVGISDVSHPKKIEFLDNQSELLKKQSFDIVCAGASIGYSKRQEHTIKELLSLIKPGGYFINIEMNEKHFGKKLSEKYSYKPLPLDNIKKIISDEGCEVSAVSFSLKEFPAGLSRHGIVARKK